MCGKPYGQRSIKKSLLSFAFLLLLPVSVFSLSESEAWTIAELRQTLLTVSGELTLLRNQREYYRQKIAALEENSKASESLLQDLRQQIETLNGQIETLNETIANSEKSLTASETEIAKLTAQSTGLEADLTDALNLSGGLERESKKYRIGCYVLSGIAVVELGVIVVMGVRATIESR